jgi:hypothetical protein
VPSIRVALALGGPLMLVAVWSVVPLLLLGVLDAIPGLDWYLALASFPSAIVHACGGLAVLNPFAVPLLERLQDAMFGNTDQLTTLMWNNKHDIVYEVVRVAALPLTQCVTIWVLARFAREAVAARRRRGVD